MSSSSQNVSGSSQNEPDVEMFQVRQNEPDVNMNQSQNEPDFSSSQNVSGSSLSSSQNVPDLLSPNVSGLDSTILALRELEDTK